MITPAQRAEIRRLFYGEHWKVGTIAAQLGLHHETVRAAVERETAGVRPSLCRPSILDSRSLQGRALSKICRLIGRLIDRWGRLTDSWGSEWRPAAFVGSIAHRQTA